MARPLRKRAQPQRQSRVAGRKSRQRRAVRLLAYGACLVAVGVFIALGIQAGREPKSQMPPPIQVTRTTPTSPTGAVGAIGSNALP